MSACDLIRVGESHKLGDIPPKQKFHPGYLMRSWKFVLPLLASSLCFAAQPDRIPGPIDSTQMVPLKGNVHGLVQTRVDLGRTDGSQIIHEVTLVFHPSTAQQADLDNLLVQQQDRSSPNYHQWLTPAQFGDRFGMSQGDITRIVSWLESQGLTVTSVANSRNQISFDGTVAQVESVFATEIHNYLVDGVIHFANATNPSVPAALAGSVLAIGHLHNFSPKPHAIVRKVSAEAADPKFTSSASGIHFVAPGDFATIYDVGPLYSGGTTATGQTIALTGQSSISLTDVANFRSAAGLTANVPTLLLVPNTGVSTRCSGDEGESDLDVEWSAAVAQNASVTLVYVGLASGDSCTSRQFGAFDALQYAIDQDIAPIISNSYGNCESSVGLSFAQTMRGWIQQANSQGQTVISATGDSGAADCDFHVTSATHGPAVDLPAAIPEVTGMGGTEFNGDAEGATPVNGVVPSTQYWAGTNGTDVISSALSYIPEMGWNDTSNPENTTEQILASGGGASIFFSKPTWQTGTGVPSGNNRDVPDLALNASPDHDGYLFCSEDGTNNTIVATCTNGFRDSAGDLAVVGGTSAAAPTFAGIIALLNQHLGASGLGNINPTLYSLAASNPSAFNDVTVGNNIVPCTSGSTGCPTTGAHQYGFSAGTGYDQVTGLGSVDANKLATAWASSRTVSSITIKPSTMNATIGSAVTFDVAVTPSTGVGTVTFSTLNGGSTTVLGTATLNTPFPPSQSGTAAFTTSALPGGSNTITASYGGDASNASTSAAATVNVTVPFTLSPAPSSLSVAAGQPVTSIITIAPLNGFNQAVNFNSASTPQGGCTAGLPAGAVCSFNPGSVILDGTDSKNVALTITTAANMALVSGVPITVSATTGSTLIPTTVALTVTATTESFTIAPTTGSATFSVAAGATIPISITVSSNTGFVNPGSNTTALPLTFTCTGLPSESTASFSPGGGGCAGASSDSATSITMNIVTTAPTAQARPPLGRDGRLFYAMLLPGIFGIVLAKGSRTRGARLLGLIVVLGFSTLWLGSCSGASGGGQKNAGTTPGTYAVVVNATTGGANPIQSHFTVNLTVTP
jgi:subtilase family serine protease